MITSQPPGHVRNIYNSTFTIISLAETNLSRMGDQYGLVLQLFTWHKIPLCPVINVDGFIPASVHDIRPEYTILTLQAMIASAELSHRAKVTGFISPESQALYPLFESYNNKNWQDFTSVRHEVMTMSPLWHHATHGDLSLLSCLVFWLTLPLILMDMRNPLIAMN